MSSSGKVTHTLKPQQKPLETRSRSRVAAPSLQSHKAEPGAGKASEVILTRADRAGEVASWYARTFWTLYQKLFRPASIPEKIRFGYGLVSGAGLRVPKINMTSRVQVIPPEATTDGFTEIYFDRRFNPTEDTETLASTVAYAVGRALHASEPTAHGESFVETMTEAGFQPGPDTRPSRVNRPGATGQPVTWARPMPTPAVSKMLEKVLGELPQFPAGVVDASEWLKKNPGAGQDDEEEGGSVKLRLPGTKIGITLGRRTLAWLEANAADATLYYRGRDKRYWPLGDGREAQQPGPPAPRGRRPSKAAGRAEAEAEMK